MKIKWILGGFLLLINLSLSAQEIKSIRIVSVPLSATSITRVSCKEFDRYFDVKWRREVAITKPEIRKRIEIFLNHFKPLKLAGIDVRGKLIINYCDTGSGDKTICFDGFGHFYLEGTVYENLDLFNFLLHSDIITEGL